MALVISYGSKHGPAPKGHLSFTVKDLPNPHSIPALRGLRGTDPKVKDWMLGKHGGRVVGKVKAIVKAFQDLGNPDAVITIGCYGGRHRSVVVAELVAIALGPGCHVGHRDLDR